MSDKDLLELGGNVMPQLDLSNARQAHKPKAYQSPSVDYRERDLVGASSIYDKTTDETQAHRKVLLDTLMTTLSSTIIDTSEKANTELLQGQLRLVNECRSLLNDIDSAENKNLSAKIKMKDSETQASQGMDAARFLSQIKLTNIPACNVVQTNIDEQLSVAYTDGGAPILETEIGDTPNMLPIKVDDDFI